MCAPLSIDDNPLPASVITPDDIREHISRTCRLLGEMGEAAIKLLDGATLDAFGGRSTSACAPLVSAELAMDELRGMVGEALTGRPISGYVNSTDLARYWRGRIDENEIRAGRRPRDPLATAMRRAEAAAEGDALVLAAHARGATLAASLPPYASLEAGFVSPASA